MRERRRRRSGRRRALVTVVVVLAVVAGITGGPWVYARFIAPEPPAPLTVGTAMTTSPPPAPAVVDPDGTWTVGEGSEAGYRLDEVLSGQDVVVVGRTSQVSGSLTVEGNVLTQARVVVDVASITTPESARDAYFRRALDTSTYPEATFELGDPVDVSAVGGPGDGVTVELAGTITIRGTSVPTTVQAVVHLGPDGLEVAGSAPVTLADFGLTAPDLPFVTVAQTGTIEVLLVLEP